MATLLESLTLNNEQDIATLIQELRQALCILYANGEVGFEQLFLCVEKKLSNFRSAYLGWIDIRDEVIALMRDSFGKFAGQEGFLSCFESMICNLRSIEEGISRNAGPEESLKGLILKRLKKIQRAEIFLSKWQIRRETAKFFADFVDGKLVHASKLGNFLLQAVKSNAVHLGAEVDERDVQNLYEHFEKCNRINVTKNGWLIWSQCLSLVEIFFNMRTLFVETRSMHIPVTKDSFSHLFYQIRLRAEHEGVIHSDAEFVEDFKEILDFHKSSEKGFQAICEVLNSIGTDQEQIQCSNIADLFMKWRKDDAWIGRLRLHRIIAQHMRRVSAFESIPFAGLKSMDFKDIGAQADDLMAKLCTNISDQYHSFQQTATLIGLDGQTEKYLELYELRSIQYFHCGLESQIGFPKVAFASSQGNNSASNVKNSIGILDIMSSEHQCAEAFIRKTDGEKVFPNVEWRIVMEGLSSVLQDEFRLPTEIREKGYHVASGRDITLGADYYVRKSQEEFDKAETLLGTFGHFERLNTEEVAALRLWTGPMYQEYARIYRDARPDNAIYVTTLHAINSAIIKLSKIWVIPRQRTVFRGCSNRELDPKILQKDTFGCSGGVEPSVLATTVDWETAVRYSCQAQNGKASKRPGIVFKMEVGQIDRGADIHWLSQYPHEKEVLFNALSSLEVTGRMEICFSCNQIVFVCPVHINSNLKSRTLQDFQILRMRLHEQMSSLLVSEFRQDQKDMVLEMNEDLKPILAPSFAVLTEKFSSGIAHISNRLQPQDYNRWPCYESVVKEIGYLKLGAESLKQFLAKQFPWKELMAGADFRTEGLKSGCNNEFLEGAITWFGQSLSQSTALIDVRPKSHVRIVNSTSYVYGGLFSKSLRVDLQGTDVPLDCEVESSNIMMFRAMNTFCDKFSLSISNTSSAQTLALMASLVRLQNLTYLELSSNGINEVAAVELANCLMSLTGLRSLILEDNYIDEKGTTALSECLSCLQSLKSLHLCSALVNDSGSTALAGCLTSLSCLQWLRLENNSICGEGAAMLAASFKKLTSLHGVVLGLHWIDHTEVLKLGNHLACATNLQHLNVGCDTMPGKVNVALAGFLGTLPRLYTLILQHQKLGDEESKILANHLSGLTTLRTLNLRDNKFTCNSAKNLAECFIKLTNLQSLSLSSNQFGDSGATALANCLKKLTSLRALRFGQNCITDEGVTAMAECFRRLTSLQTIELSSEYFDNKGANKESKYFRNCFFGLKSLQTNDRNSDHVGNEGAHVFAECLRNLTSLQTLMLAFEYVGDEGITALAASIRTLTSLQGLNFGFRGANDGGATAVAECLRSMASLQHLSLYFNHTNICEGISALEQSVISLKSLQAVDGEEGEDNDFKMFMCMTSCMDLGMDDMPESLD